MKTTDLDAARGIALGVLLGLPTWILMFLIGSCASRLWAQGAETHEPRAFVHALRVNAIAAPLADTWTTLATNRFGNLTEANPLLARADGTASPTRLVAMKAGSAALTLTILHLTQRPAMRKERLGRWIAYGVVVGLNGLEWRAALHNARLPHGTRR